MQFLSKIFEPKIQIEESRKGFSNAYIKNLILPLFGEQLLIMLVGMANLMISSYIGEAAVSGISLVVMFNTIFVYLFTALATGGAVVVSQYIGNKDRNNGNLAASQIYMVSFVFSVISMVPVLVFSRQILGLLFGKVDADVMSASMTYLRILTISFPAVALYNAGAALFRSMGKTSITMKMSFIMNFINAAGGAIGIFAFHAGVAGVAWPATISWIIAAVVMTFLCFNINNPVNISWNEMFLWDWRMIKRLLGIAVPNGIENGLFQLAKVALGSIVALFGTTQIAANGVAQSIWSMAAVVGMAMGPAFITVTGQCIGAGDADAADYFMKKILRITFAASVLWNALTLAITPLFLMLYNLSDETKHLVFILVIIHNIFNAFVFPVAGPFSNALRAAGDVKFTMYVSIFTTVVCRVLLSILFGIWMNLGVIGIALAMVCDWCIKTLILIFRYRRGRWKEFRVI